MSLRRQRAEGRGRRAGGTRQKGLGRYRCCGPCNARRSSLVARRSPPVSPARRMSVQRRRPRPPWPGPARWAYEAVLCCTQQAASPPDLCPPPAKRPLAADPLAAPQPHRLRLGKGRWDLFVLVDPVPPVPSKTTRARKRWALTYRGPGLGSRRVRHSPNQRSLSACDCALSRARHDPVYGGLQIPRLIPVGRGFATRLTRLSR